MTAPMKLVAEYLEHVRLFESIAAREENPRLKVALERQAVMYRRRAEICARQLGQSFSDGA
jgi:hypothetical protein